MTERVAVVTAALGFTRAALLTTFFASTAAAVLLVARRVLAAATLRSVRAGTASAIVRSLLASTIPFDAGEDDDALTVAVAGLTDGPQFVAGLAPALFADAVSAIIIAPFLVIRLPPRTLLVGAVALGLAALTVAGALRLTAHWSAAAHRAFAVVYDDLAAAVGGRLEIVASGRAERFLRDLDNHLDVWQREHAKGSLRMALATRVPFVAAAAVAGVAIWLDAAAKGIPVRQALGQGLVVASTAPVFVGLLRGAFDWVRSTEAMRPLVKLLGPKTGGSLHGASDVSTAGAPKSLGRIDWQGLWFAYTPLGPEPRFVLRDFTGECLSGTAIGIRGPNGCGKSTLLRLTLGIGSLPSGRILVGGTDLLSLDLSVWRRSVAYLPQRPFIPERATVREAVRFIVEDATDESICAALVRVELWPALAVEAPNDPLDVRVIILSAGQRQRLALARVLCQQAPVVLLDEPDANLDASGVRCLAAIIRELASKGMVVFAAHTEELLNAADRVVTLGHISR